MNIFDLSRWIEAFWHWEVIIKCHWLLSAQCSRFNASYKLLFTQPRIHICHKTPVCLCVSLCNKTVWIEIRMDQRTINVNLTNTSAQLDAIKTAVTSQRQSFKVRYSLKSALKLRSLAVEVFWTCATHSICKFVSVWCIAMVCFHNTQILRVSIKRIIQEQEKWLIV